MKFPKISQHKLNTILALSVGITLLLASFVYFYKIRQIEGLKSSKYWRPMGYKDQVGKERGSGTAAAAGGSGGRGRGREDWELGDDKGDIVFQYKRKNLLKISQDGAIQNVTIDKLKHRLNSLEQKIKAKPSAGIPGETGPQGIQGPVGPQGIIGVEGDLGPQGLLGLRGSRGPEGLRGPTNTSASPPGLRGGRGPRGGTGSRGPNASCNVNTCLAAAKMKFGSNVTSRRGLQIGPWGWVPHGCTIQLGGDWAAHWNTTWGGNDRGMYSQVC